MKVPTPFGRLLRARRRSWGMTREELGLLLHLSWRQIARYENEDVAPTGRTLALLLQECERRGEDGPRRAYQMLKALEPRSEADGARG